MIASIVMQGFLLVLQPFAKCLDQGMRVFAGIAAARHVGRTLLNGPNEQFEFGLIGELPAQKVEDGVWVRIMQVFLVNIDAERDAQEG